MKRFKIRQTSKNRISPCLRAGIGFGLVLCLMLLYAAAGFAEKKSADVQAPVLSHSEPTMKKLCRRMLAAMAKKDRAQLAAMAITEKEFKTVIWPQLAVSRIKQWENRIDFVWSQHELKSSTCLNDLMSVYGGRRFSLKEVKINGEVSDYQTYRVHRNASLVVTDDKGETREINFFGSIVEQKNRFKIMSYNVH